MGKKKQHVEKAKKPEPKPNPFDRLPAVRPRMVVMGQKPQTAPIASRSILIAKRKQYLEAKTKLRSKAGAFIDRRIGENNREMAPEEKLLARFQRERQRRLAKTSMYSAASLDDDEQMEEEPLTHLGLSLDDADDYLPSSDDEEDHKIDEKSVKELHFGGGDDLFQPVDPNRQKTRAEIMSEVIAKSKMFRAEHQRQKEEKIELTRQLDKDLREIKPVLISRKDDEHEEHAEVDEFDTLVRELLFEGRAPPSDRLKTEEEIAQEQRQRLERLEKERLARMRDSGAEFIDVEEEEEESGDANQEESSGSEDEDNEEGEEEDEEDNESGDEDDEEEGDSDDEEDEDEAEGIEDDISEGDDDEDNGPEISLADLVDGSEGLAPEIEQKEEKHKKKPQKPLTRTEKSIVEASLHESAIPFVIEVPKEHEEFIQLINGRTIDEQRTIIARILACSHVSLGGDKKEALGRFAGILFAHIDHVVDEAVGKSEPIPGAYLNFLCTQLFQLCQQIPDAVAGIAQLRLVAIESATSQLLLAGEGSWKLHDFSFLQMLPRLFPVTDFQHKVITPALLLMSQFVSQLPVTNGPLLLSKIMVCGILLDYLEPARRYSPEAVAFVSDLLRAANGATTTLNPIHRAIGSILARGSIVQTPLDDLRLSPSSLLAPANDPFFSSPEFRLRVLFAAFELLDKTQAICASIPVYVEIFEDSRKSLSQLLASREAKKWPALLRASAQTVNDRLQAKTQETISTRRPLVHRRAAMAEIKLLRPRFDEKFDPRHKRLGAAGQDEKYVARQRLRMQRHVKREKKVVTREIRRDAAIVAQTRLQERLSLDEEKKRGWKKINTMLQTDQASYNTAAARSKK